MSRALMSPVLVRRPRTAGLVLAAAVTAMTLMQMYLRRDAWLGWTPTTVSSWVMAAAVGPPSVVAAASAWWTGAAHRSGLDWWLPGQGHRRRLSAAQSSLQAGAWGVAGALLSLGIAFMATLSVDGLPTSPVLPTVGAVLALVLALLCVAEVAGAASLVLPASVVLPLAIVVPYIWFFVTVGFGAETLAAAIGPADGVGWDFRTTSTSTVMVRCAFWSTLTVVLISTVLQSRLRRASRWLLGASLALAILGGLATTEIPRAQSVKCQGSDPRICVTANQEAARPQLTTAVDRAMGHLPAALHLPALSTMDSPTGSARPILSNSKVVGADVIAAQIGEETMFGQCSDISPGRTSAEALLHWWWVTNDLPLNAPTYPGALVPADFPEESVSAGNRIHRMSRDDRDRFLTRHSKAILACTLAPQHLP